MWLHKKPFIEWFVRGNKNNFFFAIDDDLITWIIGCECWYYYDNNNQQISVLVTLHLLFPCQNTDIYKIVQYLSRVMGTAGITISYFISIDFTSTS